ncbi:prolipoprotein diacylglyceryl transferase [Rhodoluna lacicola]|uniref:Phosphatidylglycerol--prolipoprotein diacylglyceryl transferase n=2 Tax=Rhodoluna lacicola TaxID=529884 RepID=A0A060JFQ9_9MICO|nr:prolipoprotein diacylglyceryl transferase [Rhodoluna lacicola]
MQFLASIPSPPISFFMVGPFKIHFYALCILTGMILAIWLADRRLVSRGATSGLALDIALWTIPIAVVGARIFHVLTHSGDYFYPGADLTAVLRIWEGGIAIYGGLIGGAIGAWIGSNRAGIKFWSFADAVAPGILLAQAIGRWGNYFNQELFGFETTLPWGLEIDPDNPAFPPGLPADTLFHPTFLYESIWSLIGVAILLSLDKRLNLRWGTMFGAYLIYYSLGRLITENLRIDPSDIILGLRTNVWSAILGVLVGALIIYWQKRQHPGPEASVYKANALDSRSE